jgi:hypothetical protein
VKTHLTRDGFVIVELEDGDLPPEAFTHRLPLGKPIKEPNRGKVTICLSREAVSLLGQPGRVLGSSKAQYRKKHPRHEVLFNACLFDDGGREIWFGDVDLTVDEPELKKLANRIGPIILTPELPYRFEGLSPNSLRYRRVRRYAGEEHEG